MAERKNILQNNVGIKTSRSENEFAAACFYTYIISVATNSVALFRKLLIMSDNTFVLTHQTFM